MQLEHLTRKDIDFYVRDHFNQSQGFRELKAIHPDEAGRLLAEIVEKSKGVFLWVSVVVRLLLENLSEGDKVADLRKTLAHLADDVRQLFDHIWASIDPKYYSEALQYCQMMTAAEECGMTVYCLCLYFADDDIPIDMDINKVFISFLIDALSSVQRRLSSRTRGILEFYQPKEKHLGSVAVHSARVEYLHRTAKEWVTSRWTDLRAMDPEVDPCLALLKGEANRMATDNYILPYFSKEKFWSQVRLVFRCSSRLQDVSRNYSSILQVLDKIDRQISAISKVKDRGEGYLLFPGDFLVPDDSHDWPSQPAALPHWCNAPILTSLTHFDRSLEVDFMSSMAQIPVPAYVKAKALEAPDDVPNAVLRDVAFGQIPMRAGRGVVLKQLLGTETLPPNNDVIRLELVEMLISRRPSNFHLSRLEEDCKSSAVPKEYREYVKELAARLNTSGPERETRVKRRPRIWIRVLKLIVC